MGTKEAVENDRTRKGGSSRERNRSAEKPRGPAKYEPLKRVLPSIIQPFWCINAPDGKAKPRSVLTQWHPGTAWRKSPTGLTDAARRNDTAMQCNTMRVKKKKPQRAPKPPNDTALEYLPTIIFPLTRSERRARYSNDSEVFARIPCVPGLFLLHTRDLTSLF